MFDKGLAKGCLGAVAGLVAIVLAVLVLNMGVWWSIGLDDPYAPKSGPELVRHTSAQFRERSEQALRDTVGGLGPNLVLSDSGYDVRQYGPRANGVPSRLSHVDRQLTARTRILASHRAELRDAVAAEWRAHGYKESGWIWTPSEPEKGPDYNFSAESPDGIGVFVQLVPGPDQTLGLTVSVRGDGVEYDPAAARPAAALQPDIEDAHWSH
ncbi:hypothetical protein J5Y04_18365 [Kitasatospora sp. RG8]|uniref:hypothetical protein n=1 Tax=Kitasatospora sp. RG8 TaxID=2820815 RepID=UPI001ADF3F6D|nr:hypothetical protein [Kitasatospora sp. RG8]MBP0451494.1 hypothetical protein [Kitasatospora sp. RG8]